MGPNNSPQQQDQYPYPSNVSGPQPQMPQVSSPPPMPADAGPGRNLKKPLMIVAAFVVLLVIIVVIVQRQRNAQVTAVQGDPAVVEITANGFVPATIKIAKGQSVEWVNADTEVHQPATDPYPLENGLAGFVDPVPINSGEVYGFNFSKTGTFTYHDHLHPFKFTGTVIVGD